MEGGHVVSWANRAPTGGSFDVATASKPTFTTFSEGFSLAEKGAVLFNAIGNPGDTFPREWKTNVAVLMWTEGAPASITAGSSYSAEYWVYNSSFETWEGTITWGERKPGTHVSWNTLGDYYAGVTLSTSPGNILWDPEGAPPRLPGEFHHCVVTYNSHLAQLRLYLDGELRNTLTGATWPGDFNIATGDPVCVGGGARDNEDGAGRLFYYGLSGALSQVRVHDGVLTPAQVKNNYNEDADDFRDGRKFSYVKMRIEDEDNSTTPETHVLAWDTLPGVRYEVQTTTDLLAWRTVDGYPAEATGTKGLLALSMDESKEFFRVVRYDEQAPEIAIRYPDDGDFAVKRFGKITMALSDLDEVDVDSISLNLGDLGSFNIADTELTFSDGLLSFDAGGDVALGAYGETLTAVLVVEDTIGNRETYQWTFELEVETELVENLFVFGSPDAQRSGQRIGAIPTAHLAQRLGGGGPVRMNDVDPWTIQSVGPNSIVLAYTGATAPAFAVGTFLANLTPAHVSEIFYRKITSVHDDPANKRLTLGTVDVLLGEIVKTGSLSISDDSVLLTVGEDGTITRALALGGQIDLPPLGHSRDGSRVFEKSDWLTVDAEQLHWWLNSSLKANMEFGWNRLERFNGVVTGDIDAAIVLDANVNLGDSIEVPIFELTKKPERWIQIGVIGTPPLLIPVYAKVVFDFAITGNAESEVNLNFRAGIIQKATCQFGINYEREREPAIHWIKDITIPPPKIVEPELEVYGKLSVGLDLAPSVSFLVYGAAGAKASLVASGAVVFETEPCPGGRFEADVSLTLEPDGPALEWLDIDPLSKSLWSDQFPFFRGSFDDLNLKRTIVNPTDGSVLKLIPSCPAFLAGEDKFEVSLPAYYISETEVTNAQYQRFVDATGHPPIEWDPDDLYNRLFPELRAPDHPVIWVSWYDAYAYCQWAGVRLPSELEWEKAARGTDGREYPWGNTWDESKCRSWYTGINAIQPTCVVSDYPSGKSPYGIYNMAGNVLEWCADWFDRSAYERYQTGDLTPPERGGYRVLRGGSWVDGEGYLRCARRDGGTPEGSANFIGFRVARSPRIGDGK